MGRGLSSAKLVPVEPVSRVRELPTSIKKFPKAVAVVMIKLPFIGPAIVPGVHPVACLLVSTVVALIVLKSMFPCLPNSVAGPVALFEISPVGAGVFPEVLAIALGKAIGELPPVKIPICILLLALPVLKSVLKGAGVLVSIGPLVGTWSIGKASPPASLVVLDVFTSLRMLRGEVEPVEVSLAVLLVIQKLPQV